MRRPAGARSAAAAALILIVAVSGCGDTDRQAGKPPTTATATAPAATPAADDGITLVAALGDSITAGTPLWDPDPGAREQIGGAVDVRSQYEYWAQRRLGPRVRFRNCGVNRQRTDEIALRLDDCARGADVLVLQGGINDIAQGRGPAQAAASLRAMARRGKALGLRVELVEVLPWNNGYPAAVSQIDELNASIHDIGRDQRVPVLPFYSALEEPDRPIACAAT